MDRERIVSLTVGWGHGAWLLSCSDVGGSTHLDLPGGLALESRKRVGGIDGSNDLGITEIILLFRVLHFGLWWAVEHALGYCKDGAILSLIPQCLIQNVVRLCLLLPGGAPQICHGEVHFPEFNVAQGAVEEYLARIQLEVQT